MKRDLQWHKHGLIAMQAGDDCGRIVLSTEKEQIAVETRSQAAQLAFIGGWLMEYRGKVLSLRERARIPRAFSGRLDLQISFEPAPTELTVVLLNEMWKGTKQNFEKATELSVKTDGRLTVTDGSPDASGGTSQPQTENKSQGRQTGAVADEQEKNRLERELAKVRQEKKRFEQELAKVSQEKERFEQELAKVGKEKERFEQELAKVGQKEKPLGQELTKVRQEKERLEQELEKARQEKKQLAQELDEKKSEAERLGESAEELREQLRSVVGLKSSVDGLKSEKEELDRQVNALRASQEILTLDCEKAREELEEFRLRAEENTVSYDLIAQEGDSRSVHEMLGEIEKNIQSVEKRLELILRFRETKNRFIEDAILLKDGAVNVEET